MDILEMHEMFRVLGQQMGLERVRGILEESIDRVLAPLPRKTALRNLFDNHRELQEQLMLIPDVVFKVMQQQLVKAIESQLELGVE